MPISKTVLLHLLSWLVFSGILYRISQYNYLLFHGFAELFSVAVATAIFMLAWNTRRFMQHQFLFVIGVAYFFAGLIDLLHTLAYKGMGVFPGDSNLPTQLWIAARYLQSLSVLAAVLFFRKKINVYLLLGIFLAVTLVLVTAIATGHFPDCYLNGLTPFKKVSEYIISGVLVTAALVLRKEEEAFSPRIYRLIMLSLMFTILSELTFTFYVDVYGLLNFLGHMSRIFAVYCMYEAIVGTGLTQPIELLFHDMQQREQELETSQRMLREIAMHDTLTGLANRFLFDARLTHALEECQRANYRGMKSMVQVIIIDLDNFKHVNDTLGHLIGDEVLKSMGQRLKTEMRASDTVARWGGDEFTCIIENVASIEDARHMVRKIVESVSAPMQIRDDELKISASLGFSLFPLHGEDGETLLRNADAALYRAKETKDSFHMYEESMNIFKSQPPASTTQLG